jgi:hypothetical protein
MMRQGGRTVYLGPSEEALGYFENLGFRCPEHVNPPDFFMDLIAGDVVSPPERPNFDPVELFDLWNEKLQADVCWK